MQLSKRMDRLASMVTEGSSLADVGTDHGYIPIALVQTGKVSRAIAMDINKGPLERAALHIREQHLEDRITTRLSDGMTALKEGEADTVLIAGMGGALTVHILEGGAHCLASVKELILQPQSEIWLVREWLCEHGYKITDEDIVLDEGKYYPMMKVRPPVADTAGEDTEVKCWDTVQLKYGKLLLEKQHPVLREYLEREIRIYQSILEGLKAKDSDRIRQRKEELEQELVEAEKGMKYYAV